MTLLSDLLCDMSCGFAEVKKVGVQAAAQTPKRQAKQRAALQASSNSEFQSTLRLGLNEP